MEKQQTQTDTRRLIRLTEVLELLPISRSSWWAGVQTGKYPRPVKLGPRTTCWRLVDILELTERGVKPNAQRGEPSQTREAAE